MAGMPTIESRRHARALRAANRPIPLGAGARRVRRRKALGFALQLLTVSAVVLFVIWSIPVILELTTRGI